uniref:Macaca fascicularis brain cDNA, clone: QflA-16678 n=3 Tax=Cercopithecinae TaxID=9528 RepID=I7GBG4_MACFA|nr:unnamed protein product [Macaca fascicularis]
MLSYAVNISVFCCLVFVQFPCISPGQKESGFLPTLTLSDFLLFLFGQPFNKKDNKLLLSESI